MSIHNRDAGIAAFREGAYELAAEHFEAARLHSASDYVAASNASLAYLRLKKWDLALGCANDALQRHKASYVGPQPYVPHAKSLLRRGTALLHSEQFAEAIEALEHERLQAEDVVEHVKPLLKAARQGECESRGELDDRETPDNLGVKESGFFFYIRHGWSILSLNFLIELLSDDVERVTKLYEHIGLVTALLFTLSVPLFVVMDQLKGGDHPELVWYVKVCLTWLAVSSTYQLMWLVILANYVLSLDRDDVRREVHRLPIFGTPLLLFNTSMMVFGVFTILELRMLTAGACMLAREWPLAFLLRLWCGGQRCTRFPFPQPCPPPPHHLQMCSSCRCWG